MKSLQVLAFLAATVGLGPSAVAQHNLLTDEERSDGWLLLFDGKTTGGWHSYGQDAVLGWDVEDGELVALGLAADDEGDIVTDELFSSFELSLEWKISPQGNSGILFAVVEDTALYEAIYHTGPEYQLIDGDGWPDPLEEWQKTGSNYAMHNATSRPTRPVGEWNHSRILVNGPHVEHWLNGKKIVEYELWTDEWHRLAHEGKWKDYPDYAMARIGRIGLQDHGVETRFRNVKIRHLRPAPSQETALFNGENLDGWKIHGTEKWYVEDGELICESGPDEGYGYLVTERDFKDFELELEFLQEAQGNSGVFFRSSIEGTKISGWQAEVAAPGNLNGDITGGIYESYGRGWLQKMPKDKEAILKIEGWNHMRVLVRGDRVDTWLNEVHMAGLNDSTVGEADGKIALQIHDGGGIKVRWRNLYIRAL